VLTFSRLKWTSFLHSLIYLALLICAFAAGKPEPLTEVLGWTHGVLWISMSLACMTAARRPPRRYRTLLRQPRVRARAAAAHSFTAAQQAALE
jgi:hypothetical protein